MLVLSSARDGRGCRTTAPWEVGRLLGLGERDALGWVFENGKVYVRRAQG